MAQNSINFEWQVVDDVDWVALPLGEQLTGSLLSHKPGASNSIQMATFPVALVLRSIIVVCASLFITTSTALPQIYSSNAYEHVVVLTTLHLEDEARQKEDHALLERIIDPNIHQAWQHEWRTPLPHRETAVSKQEPGILSISPLDDAADNIIVVQTLVKQASYESWRFVPYRENRFYRQTNDGWMRTVPDPAYWGEKLALETPHLRFEFHQRDATLVMPIMARMEQIYLSLYTLLELETPSTTNKITFALIPEPVRGQGSFASRHLFTSPMLDKVPEEFTDTDFLMHLMVNRLANRAVDSVIGENTGYHATGYATYGYEWRNVRRATSGWLRTVLLAQRSHWRQEAEMHFRAQIETALPLQLTRAMARSTGDPDDSAESMYQYMLAESVIGYITATYGLEHLVIFVRSLGRHDSWDRLALEVFRTSRTDFETGWNDYLRAAYLSHTIHTPDAIAP